MTWEHGTIFDRLVASDFCSMNNCWLADGCWMDMSLSWVVLIAKHSSAQVKFSSCTNVAKRVV